jgi:succinate dehydrogenase/fumarate reductase flavoprotein subunit
MPAPSRVVDVLVLGSGAGGMTAALTAAALGLDTLLVEKAEVLGGTTALSAGSVWIPNSRHAPPDDDPQDASIYLREALGNRYQKSLIEAFLRAGPELIDFLADNSDVVFRAYPYHPDYLATLQGARLNGRALEPLPFDAAVLGQELRRLRKPIPEFTLFGGMMVDRTDIGHLLNAGRSIASMWHAARLVARYSADALRFGRGARLVMGNALIGRLYHSLRQRHVPVLTSTTALRLTAQEGGVAGAVLQGPDDAFEVQCRRGVILATGGFSRNPVLRRELMPALLGAHSPVAESVTGDGLALAAPFGGHLGELHSSNSFWAPISLRARDDGSMAVFPHLVLDRGKPGLIAVNPAGVRFVSEATSYHLFVEAMLTELERQPAAACFLICDDEFISAYGLGMVRPRRLNLRAAIRDGYLVQSDSISGLAKILHLPGAALEQTVARHSGFARTGIDTDFGKGSDAYQRNLGDAGHGPNPCIGPLAKPPFYAVKIFPGDIGASCGLVTNEHAQVLRDDGSRVAGLYACGNDMNSIMAGIYPGPGITLGPAMTFGYIAARHAANPAAWR